jgi:transketolase
MSVDVARRWSSASMETRAPSAAFVETLGQLAASDPRVVVLTSDQAGECGLAPFAEAHEGRFFNLGSAERNLIGVAAGMAVAGKVPFVVTSGSAASLAAGDLMRTTIARSGLHVILAAMPAGLEGSGGGVRHALEDLAVMMCIPNLRVVVPADAAQTAQAARALLAAPGPAYLRLIGRESPVVIDETTPFELGAALTLREGTAMTLAATGALTVEALLAAEQLEAQGIAAQVLNLHTLKPLDVPSIRRAAKETGGLVVAEEHYLRGGLGAAIAEEVARTHPVPIEFVAVEDRFITGGLPDHLGPAVGLRAVAIVKAAERLRERMRR